MFNNNYERNLLGKFNYLDENKNNQMKYEINNNLAQKQLAKNLFFDNVNLFNQSHSNNNINRNLSDKNSIYNKNSFFQNSEKKSRDLNYNNYSKFYGETNNRPYVIANEASNNINNFQNIHNINIINNNYQNQNLNRYNDIYAQNNEQNIQNISNEYNNNIYFSQQRRSFSEISRRNTPINNEINTIQNRNRFFNNGIINYSDQNFYNVRNNINQFYNNNSKYEKANLNQRRTMNNLSNDIINNSMNYNSSNNTINNFYEQIQKEKERKQKEDYSKILRQQIEEKRKRKEMERQKEKEYDLKMERQYQEYLKQQKEIENKDSNLFENNTIKRPISNREKTINDIFNENNNNNIINSKINNPIQNSFQTLELENRKNLTNYNNFNNNIIDESISRNKRTTTSSTSFLNSGKGIIDSFNKKPKTVDEFQNALNINNNIEFTNSNNDINKNIQNNNINNISEDKFGFTFKNKAETEEMIDKIIKEADDYLKGTLQQTFTNKEEKEKFLYKKLNNDQNPNKKIEFKGTFGTNQMNQSLEKTAQFNNDINQNKRIESKKNNDNKLKIESFKKNNENSILPRKLLNDNEINNKKDEVKAQKNNPIVNIDELLKGIDLKALNYHSKYEEKDEKENTIKNNSNQENQDKKVEESMKSISKLVSSKTNNETWKEDNIKTNVKTKDNPENDIKNTKNENNDDCDDNNTKKEIKDIDIKNENKNDAESKKKIMNFLSNRKKDKKIKYKLGSKVSPLNEPEINIKTETKEQAVNKSIKLNGSLNPNLKITFGNGGNILSNQSIEFNRDKAKNNNLAKITFGKNLENDVKYNNTSIQNINESEIAEKNFSESLEEDEEKFDIKIKDENEINYDDMLNKNDDLKFLDFDNFLDISKINKNKNDIDDLCAIRYTKEEEQQQNQKVNEALKDAKDSSNEEELIKKNEEETKIQDIVNFSGENTLGLKYNEKNIKDIENNNQNINEEKNNNENNLKKDFNEEKEHDIEDKISPGENSLINEEDEVNTNFKNSNKQINDDEDEDDIPNE